MTFLFICLQFCALLEKKGPQTGKYFGHSVWYSAILPSARYHILKKDFLAWVPTSMVIEQYFLCLKSFHGKTNWYPFLGNWSLLTLWKISYVFLRTKNRKMIARSWSCLIPQLISVISVWIVCRFKNPKCPKTNRVLACHLCFFCSFIILQTLLYNRDALRWGCHFLIFIFYLNFFSFFFSRYMSSHI